jgi:hypothetical protein
MSQIVTINELTNVVTTATGEGTDIGALQTSVQNLQSMVNFNTKTIFTNVISKYDTAPILVTDPVSFLDSLAVTGTITQNGSSTSSGSQSQSQPLITLNATTTTLAVQTNLGNYILVTLAASPVTISFTYPPALGVYFALQIFLQQDATGSRTVVWPTSVRWGTAPTPTLSTSPFKTDIIQLTTLNGGSTWFATVIGLGF